MNNYEKFYLVVRGFLMGILGLIITVIATNLLNIFSWISHWLLFGWFVDLFLDYQSGTLFGFVGKVLNFIQSILTYGVYGLVIGAASLVCVCFGIEIGNDERRGDKFKVKAGFAICLLFSAILLCMFVGSFYDAIFPLFGLDNIRWVEWLHSICCFSEYANSFLVYGFYVGVIGGILCPIIFFTNDK